MGHDIFLFNKKGNQIGYLRYAMWNQHANYIYEIFNVPEFNAYVSGKGEQRTFYKQDILDAFAKYKKEYAHKPSMTAYEQTELEQFMLCCEMGADLDGEVTIYFG